MTGKRAVAVGVGVATVATAGVLAVGVGQRAATPAGPPPGASTTAASTTPAEPPAQAPGLVEFRSPEVGFALGYPSTWTRLDPADPQVPLLAAQGPHSFLVRVLDLPAEIGSPELPTTRQLTDEIVMSDPSVKLLAEPHQITMAGLPGHFYFYNFTDPATGLTGAHSHFFLFKGKTMIALVFQTLPADRFKDGAATFDQITGTFRME
ncbi:MAG: hypothetical protein ACRDRH_13365 [Pseudonocardia sp.]